MKVVKWLEEYLDKGGKGEKEKGEVLWTRCGLCFLSFRVKEELINPESEG